MDSAKAVIEVTAGLVPMQPIPELTRRWAILSEEWDEAARKHGPEDGDKTLMPVDHVGRLMADKQGAALAYAQLLMFQPDRCNFVRVDWIWF